MSKDDIFDLILKGAAVCLFVLALMALPQFIGGVLQVAMLWRAAFETLTGNATVGRTVMGTGIASSVTAVLKFFVYLVVARNLFNGGSFLKKVLGKTKGTQHQDATDG